MWSCCANTEPIAPPASLCVEVMSLSNRVRVSNATLVSCQSAERAFEVTAEFTAAFAFRIRIGVGAERRIAGVERRDDRILVVTGVVNLAGDFQASTGRVHARLPVE